MQEMYNKFWKDFHSKYFFIKWIYRLKGKRQKKRVNVI